MNVIIDEEMPVVMLIEALAHAGLLLKSMPDGRLLLTFSRRYLDDGETFGGFVPEFLRYRPTAPLFFPNALANALGEENNVA